MRILEVDPADESTFDQWHETYRAASQADRGSSVGLWTRDELFAELREQSDAMERHCYVLSLDGRVAGSAFLALPLKENTHRAELGVFVGPDARRRGLGSALLSHLVSLAHDRGRTVLGGEVSWPYGLGPDAPGSPGVAFARHHGFELALGDVMRRVMLPVGEDVLDRLITDAATHHAGYTLRSFIGPVPDEYAPGWAALDAVLDTEAPMGDLVIEPGSGDIMDLREREELILRQRRTSYGTVALDPNGAVAAYTQLVYSSDDGHAYQWGTLVRKDDRGHRLGVAVKVVNLRQLQRHRPDVAMLTTYNAESNSHMIEVNEALGFVPVERLGEFQKQLDVEPTGH